MIKYLELEKIKEIVASFSSSLEEKEAIFFDDTLARPALYVHGDEICNFLEFLKGEMGGNFQKIINLTAVDYVTYFEVVYHLYTDRLKSLLTVKVKVDHEKATTPSVTAVFPGVNFEEREVYDLLGIVFTGHPDLRRILLTDDFQGYPLRKDYKMESLPNVSRIEKRKDL